jgi:hypothetical protein
MIRMAVVVSGLCALVIGGFLVIFPLEVALLQVAYALYPEMMHVGTALLFIGAMLSYLGKKCDR